jgi:hypothetical protein
MQFEIYKNKINENIVLFEKSISLDSVDQLGATLKEKYSTIIVKNNIIENQLDFIGTTIIVKHISEKIISSKVEYVLINFPIINGSNIAVINLLEEKCQLIIYTNIDGEPKIMELVEILTQDIPDNIDKFRTQCIERVMYLQQKKIKDLMTDYRNLEDVTIAIVNLNSERNINPKIVNVPKSKIWELLKHQKLNLYKSFLILLGLLAIFWGILDKSTQNWDTAWFGNESIILARKIYSMNIYDIINGLKDVGSPKSSLAPIIGAIVFPFLIFFGINIPFLITNLLFLGLIIYTLTLMTSKYFGKFHFLASSYLVTSLAISPGLIYFIIHFWSELSYMFGIALVIYNTFFIQRSNLPRLYKIISQLFSLIVISISKIALLPYVILIVVFSELIFYLLNRNYIFRINYKLPKLFILSFTQLSVIIYGVVWLNSNIKSVFAFSSRAAIGDISQIYGHEGNIAELFYYWIRILLTWYYPGVSRIILIYLFLSFIFILIFFTINRKKHILIHELELRYQIICVFLLWFYSSTYIVYLSIQNGKDVRFLAPILIFLCLSVYFTTIVMNTINLKRFTIIGLTISLASTSIVLLSIFDVHKSRLTNYPSYSSTTVFKKENMVSKTDFVIENTCNLEPEATVLYAIDVIDFNYNLAQFVYNSKIDENRSCNFIYLGFNPNSKEEVLDKLIFDLDFDYVATIETKNVPDPIFNNKYILEINQFLKTDDSYQLISRNSEGVAIYKKIAS